MDIEMEIRETLDTLPHPRASIADGHIDSMSQGVAAGLHVLTLPPSMARSRYPENHNFDHDFSRSSFVTEFCRGVT